MVGVRAAVLLLAFAACVPSPRSVQHALLDVGLDSVQVLGWAPSCSPARGAYFEARAAGGEVVTGVICCARDRYDCVVEVTPPAAPG